MKTRRLLLLVLAVFSLLGVFTAGPGPATAATPDNNAIAAKYAKNPQLGAAITPLRCGLAQGGCYRGYRNGSIYWSPGTGAHMAVGAILGRWGSLNWERGFLGYPTTDESCTLAGSGCVQKYQGGRMYWQRSAGANPVKGGIGARWDQMGAEHGVLGYPISGENCTLVSGGCVQNFQGGYVYWQPSVGSHSVHGAIGAKWVQMGYERSPLGYPTSEEQCGGSPLSCVQYFQGGTINWPTFAGVSVNPYAGSTGVVVNKRRPNSPINQTPPDLAWVGSQLMRSEASWQYSQLVAGASAAGVALTPVSGFRSYDTQVGLYNSYVSQYGQAVADTISARPGYSEHQTGLVMDIGNPNGACSLQACFENTPAGQFAANNAWRYGFIIRYPWGQDWTTGYTYEPWHLRYIGVRTATDMHNRGYQTLEQYFGLAAAPSY
ncbi:D-alanyl-D-alanine carboxypeptidase [Arthrobacter stackebrandtii]|uniref:D-alanyl-D-alanine carboxypeptidase n=1 Tax=Arthrobacter stackebrandtii TaxID=272161 RepID=A0ABS4YWK4_9MICC|nr:D-alanyl-D-alanine carboxypeptidase family protein [Arthrobacter stackebrandtii]MBP2413169.1 D-alanyl-D-alanine carboxypeptidase [Arthrobacter stackebrandtii]